jgi:esterase/lipase superfamily enzyme/translation elongation factor EF-Tu-like GTPase
MEAGKAALTIGIIGEPAAGEVRLSSALFDYCDSYGLIGDSDRALHELKRAAQGELADSFDFGSGRRHYHVIDHRMENGIGIHLASNATQLDGAILVVNAQQPIGHALKYIGLARKFLIPALVIIVNDIGMQADAMQRENLEQRVREELDKWFYPLEGTRLIRLDTDGSPADTGDSMLASAFDALVSALDETIPEPEPKSTPEQDHEPPFLMPIEDVFSVEGRGTMVRGTNLGGLLDKDQAIVISGSDGDETEIPGSLWEKMQDLSETGDHESILLDGLDEKDILGKSLTTPGATRKWRKFGTDISFFDAEEGGRAASVEKADFHFSDRSVSGHLDRAVDINAHEHVKGVGVALDEEVQLAPGARYTIRVGGKTIGTGIVAEMEPPASEPTWEEHERAAEDAPVVRGIDFEIGRKNDQNIGFYYATTRAVSNKDEDFGYSGERSGQLRLGRAQVRVPNQRAPGTIDLPRDGRKILGFRIGRQKADPNKHFIIKGVEELDMTAWASDIRGQGREQALIFVHGFNNSFKDAVYRAAQIFWDLRYEGLPVLFSWASRARTKSYIYDQQSALNAGDNFLQLLDMLAEQGVEEIILLAHSMGNFLVTQALGRAKQSRLDQVRELIMAAADVDRDNFSQFCRKNTALHKRMTLYASAADKALLASMVLADDIPRAGYVYDNQPLVEPGLDTIDGTPLGDQMFGLNHGDFAAESSFLNDIARLIATSQRPPHERLVTYQQVKRTVAGQDLNWWLYPAR